MKTLWVIAILFIILRTETRPVPTFRITCSKTGMIRPTSDDFSWYRFPKQTWVRGELDMLYSECLGRKRDLCRSVTKERNTKKVEFYLPPCNVVGGIWRSFGGAAYWMVYNSCLRVASPLAKPASTQSQ